MNLFKNSMRKLSLSNYKVKYLTGIKPNAELHIGHYYGIINNLVLL